MENSKYIHRDWLCTGVEVRHLPFPCLMLRCARTVSERSRDVRAHLQPHLYDASARSLERLSAVLCSHDTGLPARHVGRH